MPKNIVILSDGTGNEVEKNLSNVLKLFRILQKDNEQLVFYDPGLGTLGNLRPWSRLSRQIKYGFYSLTGANLDQAVLKPYKFLMQHYEEGDRIYLFGYSRGAHAVRVLAGFLHLVGLLNSEQKNLCEYAYSAYTQASEKNDFKIAWRFEKVMNTRKVPIKFIGLWDTVSSVFIPTPKGIKQQWLPYTKTNPSVEYVRHALAIDEKRSLFKADRWNLDQEYKPNPFAKTSKKQDAQEVWFVGCHGDIGGGYPEEESGLAKYPLKWIISEAKKCDLKIRTSMYNHMVLGHKRKGGNITYAKPSFSAKIHNSLKWYYWPIEIIPKKVKLDMWPKRKKLLGMYIPLGESRFIKDQETIHSSVRERLENTKYKPLNLPDAVTFIE